MTATKMKSLCLAGPQVRTLLKTGKLVQFVVMEKQPIEWVLPNASVRRHNDKWMRHLGGGSWGACRAPFAVGERRWVREAFQPNPHGSYWYKADHPSNIMSTPQGYVSAWKPSCHMPRRASRLTAEVVAVEAMQVQGIMPNDAIAAGSFDHHVDPTIDDDLLKNPRERFRMLWNSTHAKPEEKWDANPWCWKVTREKVEDA